MAPRLDRGPRPGGPIVEGFRGRQFLVGGVAHDAVLLTPERALAWDAPELAALGEADLAALLDEAPEFIVLGTGEATRFVPAALVEALDARGIGLEAMDSRAAARAWTLLRAEGRRIGAALMAL